MIAPTPARALRIKSTMALLQTVHLESNDADAAFVDAELKNNRIASGRAPAPCRSWKTNSPGVQVDAVLAESALPVRRRASCAFGRT